MNVFSSDDTLITQHFHLFVFSNAYTLFCKDQWATREGITNTNFITVCAKRWRELDKEAKKIYQLRFQKVCNKKRFALKVKIATSKLTSCCTATRVQNDGIKVEYLKLFLILLGPRSHLENWCVNP